MSLLVYALPSFAAEKSEKATGKQKETNLTEIELVKTVDRPSLPSEDAGSSFRSARYVTSPKHLIHLTHNRLGKVSSRR